LKVQFGRPTHVPLDSPYGANADCLWISEERLDGIEDSENPSVLVNLVWDLVALVGFAIAQRAGVKSRGRGVPFVQAFGSWFQYVRLVRHDDFSAESLSIPTGSDPVSFGKLCGWAAAGDARAEASVGDLEGETHDFATSIIETLEKMPLAVPIHLLDSDPEKTPDG
jgi:hypothetical protein